jgi:nucleoside-diphosphate-sugar epimerase
VETWTSAFRAVELDIRDADGITGFFGALAKSLELIVHTAVQRSHDWAASHPPSDFTVTANGMLDLLRATGRHAPTPSFVFRSTTQGLRGHAEPARARCA